MSRLAADFYARPVVEVARDLVGCVLRHGGTAGIVVETEAYHHSEPACHAFVGLTPRTQVLFGPPGRAYVYRSYGIHALFNAVCEPEGTGAAVLVRALEPTEGADVMRRRRGGVPDTELCNGPGKLTQALGIGLEHDGASLVHGPIQLEQRPPAWREVQVDRSAPRIGITRAVDLDWRFAARHRRSVSRPHPASWPRRGRGLRGAPQR